jgi:Asp-tRNA(Asn)/Glu-tRNA(Gln) amidotransferase A subunit family amidase
MGLTNLHRASAAEAAQLIRDGIVTSEQLVSACLEHIGRREPGVQAWQFLDPDHAMQQAKAADDFRLSGHPIGPLHGVPVGLKDIIDTGDMPTENGSPIHAGRTPSRDAAVVSMLRAAGAVIMGKTVTTEFATRTPGKTRNPHNPAHTPGGSSSGSAAAVAAEMVPLALGSQTTGSTIRPGAYCGVYAMKPTFGLIPRTGMFQLSRSLDHVGLFARSIEDIALLLEQLVGFDERDPDTRPRARAPYREIAASEPPLPPMFAFIKGPRWSHVEAETKDAFAELAQRLGAQMEDVELVSATDEVLDWHETVSGPEVAYNLRREWETRRDGLSKALQGRIERGLAVSAKEYVAAQARVPQLVASFTELFEQRYDAIVTPAAFGTAPAGLASTGDPACCAMWTLCGMPALSVPLMQGANGLPLGVQLVGPRHGDGRLLRTARWLVSHLMREA